MQTLHISLNEKAHSYPIYFGNNLFTEIEKILSLKNYSKIFIVTDKNLQQTLLQQLQLNLSGKTECVVLSAGEKAKTLTNIKLIWTAMHDAQLDRKSLVINLGGGVITDMGGFAASTYMRGIDFVNIPTTLLSQVDASVGGKTGINFAEIKNLIGTFNQPKAIIIDTATLATLSERELVAGFAEIIKHGLIKDKNYFKKVTSKQPLEFSQQELLEIIKVSCEIKASVVQQDETENGQRKILNFGHTIGHAIESLCLGNLRPLLHGEAISIGIVAESELAKAKGLLTDKDLDIIKKSLLHAGLPINVRGLSIDEIYTKMLSDKKNTFNQINFTLLSGIGNALYNQTSDEEAIKQAISSVVK